MNNAPNEREHAHRHLAVQTKTVPWHPRYRQGVLDLLSDVPYKPALWQWEFENNPFGETFSPVLMVGRDDKVVGFNGVMPIEATEKGQPIDALWSCDFHVSEAWRGVGVGSLIKAELHRKASIIMAFGISDQASHVLQHLGWRPHQNVHNYRLQRQHRSVRDWAFSALQCFNRLRGLFEPQGFPLSVKVSSVLADAEKVNALWEREKAGYPRVVKRDYSYLDWKYQQHPLARYAFVEVWDEQRLAALMVVRYHDGTLRIVDYSGPAYNQRLKRALVRHTRRHWRHARQISAVTSDLELGCCLKAEGFFRPRTQPRFYVYEHRKDKLSRDSEWFIMAGDSDGELLGAAADFCGGDRPLSSCQEAERIGTCL